MRFLTPTGQRKVPTGNLATTVFTHSTSREAEPQLHSHCVVMNATQLPDGRWFSFSNEAAIANQKLLGQIYQNELALALQQHGYEIELKAHGQFELKGYSPKLLKAFSTRIQANTERVIRLEQDVQDLNEGLKNLPQRLSPILSRLLVQLQAIMSSETSSDARMFPTILCIKPAPSKAI